MNQKQEALLGLPLTNAEREWLTGRLEMLSVKESYQLSAALMRSGRLQELMGKNREELQATVLRMKPDVAVEAITTAAAQTATRIRRIVVNRFGVHRLAMTAFLPLSDH